VFLHKVIDEFLRKRKILPQNVDPAIRIYQALRDKNYTFIFFAHIDLLKVRLILSFTGMSMTVMQMLMRMGVSRAVVSMRMNVNEIIFLQKFCIG